MKTIETALIWPLIMLIMLLSVWLGVRSLTVTDRQINYYNDEAAGASPAEVVRIVEVVHDSLESVRDR